MRINVQSIQSDLDSAGVSIEDRSTVIAIAFSRAVSYQLDLPKEAVENPFAHFDSVHKGEVESNLAKINEYIIVDFDKTLDLTLRLWVFRYRLVYDINNSTVRDFLDAASKVGSRSIPPDVSELLIKYDNSDILETVSRYVSKALDNED